MQAGISKTTNCMCYMCLPDSSPFPRLSNLWVLACSPGSGVLYFIMSLSQVMSQLSKMNSISSEQPLWHASLCFAYLSSSESHAQTHMCVCLKKGLVRFLWSVSMPGSHVISYKLVFSLAYPLFKCANSAQPRNCSKDTRPASGRHTWESGTRHLSHAYWSHSHACWFHSIPAGSIPFFLVPSHACWSILRPADSGQLKLWLHISSTNLNVFQKHLTGASN